MRRIAPLFSMGFVFFTMLWLVLSHVFLPVSAGQKDYSLMVMDPQWTLVSIAGILAAGLGLFAAFGLFEYLKEKGGKLALAGLIVFVIGLMMELITLSWDLFIWPVLIQQPGMIEYVRSNAFTQSIQFLAAIYTLLVALLAGNMLIAISIWKTKAFPIWTAISLGIGIVLYAAGNLLNVMVASFGLAVYCAGFLGIGIRQWKTNQGIGQ